MEYLTRAEIADRLSVSRATVYRHAGKPAAPKPDIHCGESRIPLWSDFRLDEWRDYVSLFVQVRGSENARERRSESQKKAYRSKRAERIWVDGCLIHPDAPHGTVYGNKKYGCGCKPCRRARKTYEYNLSKGKQ